MLAKRAAVAAVMALTLLPAGAAGAATEKAGLGCTATPAGSGYLITAAAVEPLSLDTLIVCHVYYNGAHVAAYPGTGAGPAAVVAAQWTPPGPGSFSMCTETRMQYLTGTAHKTCG